jgi:ubiquinone/menaquinone biosynthesis C-methylase UbiE
MRYDYSKKSGNIFGNIANDYDKGRRSENIELWGKEAKRLAKLNENSIVLDLGCGTGLYTIGIGAETDALMLGMDPVQSMLYKSREKSRDVHWLNGIGEWLPIRAEVLDCIFSSQVWHHLEDKQRTANECDRTLKAGKSTIIRTIGHSQLIEKVVFKYFPEIMQNQLDVYPSNEDFEKFFINAGFRCIEFYEYSEERYQSVDEFVEIAEKKLWSMFRPISEKGLTKGVAELRRYQRETGKLIRNDELITLVVTIK